MTLTPEDHKAIASEIVMQLGELRRPSPVMTRAEARLHVSKASDAAFDRWCEKMAVSNCGQGRYSRVTLDRALDREARGFGKKAAK